ncbi:MAG: hypothetical protein ABIO32_04380 [Ferruginibacter sp.]
MTWIGRLNPKLEMYILHITLFVYSNLLFIDSSVHCLLFLDILAYKTGIIGNN